MYYEFMKRFYIMKLNKFTVVLAILLVSILAIGAVSAESVDDSGFVAVTDGDIQESVEVTDTVDDLSTANNADETVGDDSGGPDDTTSYDLDDDTYSTYFNEDGTATDALSADGNYYLNVGTLTNKDINIVSGQNIYIQGKDGEGFIKNGTITIGNGADKINTIQISGITFINNNKNAIIVNQKAEEIAIARNNFDLTYDDTYFDNAIAIMTKGFVGDVTIVGNDIKMTSAASYTYGLDLTYYLDWYTYGIGNAKNFYISSNTIDILSTAQTGMAEAMYLDTLIDSEIVDNNIHVKTTNPGVANYGMQVADSWGFFNDPWAASPYNVAIKDNTIVLDAADLAYGISVISLWGYDEDYEEIVKDMVISGNDVTINTQTEGVGISASSSDVSITDNKVTLFAEGNPVQAYTDGYIGNISYAIYVNNFNKDMGYFVNNTVTGNTIVANVQGIKVAKEEDDVQPLLVKDNVGYYDIDDGNYARFFNEDGTDCGLDSMGNYTLNIGTLTNKDILIDSGSNIKIVGKQGGNGIANGTITIGDGAGSAGSVSIENLYITNFNKNAIVIDQYTSDVSIANNFIKLTYDDSFTDSAMGIKTNGFVENIRILNNTIGMDSAATYTYAIDLAYYYTWYDHAPTNAKNFIVANNYINILSSATSGMAEAIYVDTAIDVEIIKNNVFVKTVNPGVAAYGIQVADSWGFDEDDFAASPYNISIKDNVFNLEAADLAYGISVISLWPYDDEYEALVKDIVISGNDVKVFTETEGVGICADSSDVSITDNKITLNADHNPVQAYTDSYIGNTSYAIFVNNYNADMGYFVNNTVTGNTIVANVQGIKAAKEEASAQPLVIEDNEVSVCVLIDDDSYATYFNEDGTIKDDAPIAPGNVLLLGDLTNKKLVIDTGLTIRGITHKTLVNTTINLVQGADNTVIEDLYMVFTGDETTGSIGLIYMKDVTNVTVQNNLIEVIDFVDKTGAKYGSSVYAIEVESGMLGCHDIFINNNDIFMHGTCRYLYGIDAFKTWGSEIRNTNINIFENYVKLDGGSRMAEGIYVSESDDVIINVNEIDSTSNGAAYGIATDQNNVVVIAANVIRANAATQAYGITATTSGTDTTIRANEINAEGTGAVGIGINKQNGVIIENNQIHIEGGDYSSITSSDSLGTANAAILEGNGNTNVQTDGNTISEFNRAVLVCSDLNVTSAPSGQGTYIITLKDADGQALANREITISFNNEVIKVTTNSKGVAEFSFDLNKKGTYPVSIAFLGDKDHKGVFATATITIDPIKSALTASNKNFIATASTKALTATLKDANGNVLANKTVTFTVNGKTYKATTNAKGVATVKLALSAAKTYKVTIKFAGDGVYAASNKQVTVKLIKEATKLVAPNKTFKRTLKTKRVIVTLRNSKNKAMAKRVVTLVVNKKRYTARTNSKGQAIFKVALTKRGTYKYTAKFAGNTQYKAISRNAKIVVR